MRPQQASPNDLPLLNWPHGLVSWYKICDILDQVGSVRFNWLKPLCQFVLEAVTLFSLQNIRCSIVRPVPLWRTDGMIWTRWVKSPESHDHKAKTKIMLQIFSERSMPQRYRTSFVSLSDTLPWVALTCVTLRYVTLRYVACHCFKWICLALLCFVFQGRFLCVLLLHLDFWYVIS